jgi:hypothetical protein
VRKEEQQLLQQGMILEPHLERLLLLQLLLVVLQRVGLGLRRLQL